MQLTLDPDSEVSIYQQIRDRIVEAIAKRQAREGDPLPSTRQLAADFGINFHTVNKAYDLLRQQGVIRINRKSGAVVRRDATTGPPEAAFVNDWEERMRVLLAEATVHGMDRQDVLRRCEALLISFEEGV
ncbi:GntR family transcriptional regulator [Nonomuraea phyllanthi]|uniref:GntR family transcriptional regulator n=1 Tax=Nonomuraea phyllanthi TaxID=2219224 RepID=A0A5C4VH66_9ACTN|nr:GntR family transcriptional regulator [Nonomuraea phyllanthi]KAB8188988.1 GntR family transcriptional regulator [Nonomuraea phyllanthi]QFY09553.1 GntR family transcriptional regulator [Nonomuraea phyllanthi]